MLALYAHCDVPDGVSWMKAAIKKELNALDQFVTNKIYLGRARGILLFIIATVLAILVFPCLAFSTRHLRLTQSPMNIIFGNEPGLGLGLGSPTGTVRQLFRSTPHLFLSLRNATRRTLF